jgi:hypothetical protein
VYQITAKACGYFNNPDSYFRKKHDDCYIIRALIKQQFFFEICRDFEASIISCHENRVSLLTKQLGVSMDILPKKYNKGVPMIHVEEYIIDARNISSKKLYCPVNKELVYDFCTYSGIIFVYVDKPETNAYAQLTTLCNRYKSIINPKKARIDFLVIVDSEKREIFYRSSINKMFPNDTQTTANKIPDNYINLHMRILQEKLNVDPEKLHSLPDKIHKKYSCPQDIDAADLEGIPVEELRLNGIKAVGKLANEIVNSPKSTEQKIEEVTELFRKIYKLITAGKLKKEAEFNIQVYRIGYNFSLQ